MHLHTCMHIKCILDNTNFCFAHLQGGESTREEMCLSFIYYYPEPEGPLTYCLSYPRTNQYVDWFQQYAP